MRAELRPLAPSNAVSSTGARTAALSGLCAILVGIGLARFAYSPLIPALIEAGWFSAAETGYLGAANLAGYLAGAMLAARIARRAGPAPALRAMMVLAAATFFASAFPIDFWWYAGWRFLAGLAGGVLMVLAPTAALGRIPAARQGFAGGFIFAGVGLGIALSGTLVPPLLRVGLPVTWHTLGGITVLLTILALPGWRRLEEGAPAGAVPKSRVALRPSLALVTVLVVYGLCAMGLVPHMVFLVDFVARGLGRGIEAGALIWVVFGLGAVLGPLVIGHLADRAGFALTLRIGLVLLALGVGAIAVVPDLWSLVLSSAIAGAFVPGVVTLVLGRVREILTGAPQQQRAAWGYATIAFSVGQAVAAYGFAFIFAQSGSALILFLLGAGALAMALVIDILGDRRPRGRAMHVT